MVLGRARLQPCRYRPVKMRSSDRSARPSRSPESLDQIKIGQHPVISEYASLGVGRHQDGTDRLDAGGVGWHELFPELALTGVHVEAIDSGRQFTGLVNVQRAAVDVEGDRLLSRIESRNDARLATRHRKEISLLV